MAGLGGAPERAPEREMDGRGAWDAAGPDQRVGRVMMRLSEEFGADRLRKYLGAEPRVRMDGGAVEFSVPNRTAAELLDRGVGAGLRKAVSEELGGAAVRIRVAPGAGATERAVETPTTPTTGDAGTAGTEDRPRKPAADWRPRKTLDGFAVGDANRLAYAAAVRVAEAGVEDAFAPVVIHGGCGMGKSHLLEGIAERARRVRPGLRVRMTTGDAFTGAFIDVVKRGASIEAFHRHHRRVDLLCVDDAHFLAGREATQIELLHTLEALRSVGARVVMVTDEHPLHVERLNEALASRLVSGLVVRVDPPGGELRRELIARIAAKRGLALSAGALEMLVERTRRGGDGMSPREIEGAVTQIHAVWSLNARHGRHGGATCADVEAALEVRTPRGSGRARGPMPVEEVVRAVCVEVGVGEDELMGRGRSRRVVLARSLAVLVSRRVSGASYPEIGRAMARSNHSTVITQMRSIEKRIAAGEVVSAASGLDGLSYAEAADRVERAVRRGD